MPSACAFISPAAMMALGMAGEPETEIYARAAFLFWLLLFGVVDFSLLRLRRAQNLPLPIGVLMSFLGMMAAVVALLILDSQGVQLGGFMMGIALLAIAVVAGIRKKGGSARCMLDAKRPGQGDSPICPAGSKRR